MLRSVATLAKTLYRAFPRGSKRALRRFLWTMIMRDPVRRRLFLRVTAFSSIAAAEAAGQATDPVVRDICRAHGAYRRHHWDTVVNLLTPLIGAEPLGVDEYVILIGSLVAQGRLAECRQPFAQACSWARHRDRSATAQAEVAELAVVLDDKEAALEFSERSGSAWLAQYAAVVYGIGPPVVHEALRDRLPAGTGTPGAVTVALLDYGWPSERPLERNLGDSLQTLAVMRHLARFHTPGATRCDDGLETVFASLARSWRPDERIRLDRPLDLAVVDRDCARWRGDAWLPFFGWFGAQHGSVPMTFPLPAGLLPIFFSFHLQDIGLLTPALRDYLKRYEPIGCRDRTTRDRLASVGVDAFLSGCITTTLALPEDDGSPARGPRYLVDDSADHIPGATELTHRLGPEQRSFTGRIAESLERLVLYKRATSVSTSRLHCYLPCRALGTPVTFNPKDPADIRFDGLVDLDEGELCGMAAGLTELMETILRQILAGADPDTVYRRWREATAPLVERDAAERRGYARLFARRPSRGREDARTSDPIPVALTFDRNLIDYVPNLVRSVEAHTSRKIAYHLLVRGVSAADMENLQSACGDIAIEWHTMDASFAEADDGGLLQYITVSTIDRCLLPAVLPDVDKLLYLDTDMVVLGDVAELYGTPLGDSPIAAVPKHHLAVWLELSNRPDHRGERVDQMRHLRAAASVAGPLNDWAFNAGVLLMSLENMRRDDFVSQLERNFQAFGYDDQTLLNLYAAGDYVKLPVAWNVDYRDFFFGADGVEAKIVHWNGADKPWQKDPNDAVLRTKGLWEEYSAP